MSAHEDRDPTSGTTRRSVRAAVLRSLRIAVYTLTVLLGLALLSIGTVAVIAELKGTRHWQIHLDSTVRYVGLFVRYLLVALVPLFGALVLARWRWADA